MYQYAGDLSRRPTPDSWAVKLVKKFPDFNFYVTKSLDDFEACERENQSIDNATAVWEICQKNLNGLHGSFYGGHIALWLDIFPLHFFCFIDNALLRSSPAKVMGIIERFAGLDTQDWTGVEIHVNEHASRVGTHATEAPIADAVMARLRGFYDRMSSRNTHYRKVREHGFMGCRPTIEAPSPPPAKLLGDKEVWQITG